GRVPSWVVGALTAAVCRARALPRAADPDGAAPGFWRILPVCGTSGKESAGESCIDGRRRFHHHAGTTFTFPTKGRSTTMRPRGAFSGIILLSAGLAAGLPAVAHHAFSAAYDLNDP